MVFVGFNEKDMKKIEKYMEKLRKTKERWKNVKIDGKSTTLYISNLGRTYSAKTGKYKDYRNTDFKNYKRLSIMFEGVEYKFSIHRLVAEYFCTIPKRHRENGLTFKDLVPNHKNGLKFCNASFNLEWITIKENTEHAWRTGLCDNIRGEKNHLAKMTEEQAIEVCEMIMQRKTNKEISKKVGVSEKSIQHIRSKECWNHITSRYKFPKLQEAKHYTTPESTIHQICKLLETKKYKNVEIAKMCGVKREYVKDIKTHRRRRDISQNYNF